MKASLLVLGLRLGGKSSDGLVSHDQQRSHVYLVPCDCHNRGLTSSSPFSSLDCCTMPVDMMSMGFSTIDSLTWNRVEIWDMPPPQWMTEHDTGLVMKKDGTGVIVPEDVSGSTLSSSLQPGTSAEMGSVSNLQPLSLSGKFLCLYELNKFRFTIPVVGPPGPLKDAGNAVEAADQQNLLLENGAHCSGDDNQMNRNAQGDLSLLMSNLSRSKTQYHTQPIPTPCQILHLRTRHPPLSAALTMSPNW
jgi:hypothetical protein